MIQEKEEEEANRRLKSKKEGIFTFVFILIDLFIFFLLKNLFQLRKQRKGIGMVLRNQSKHFINY